MATRRFRRWWWFMVWGTILPMGGGLLVSGLSRGDDDRLSSTILMFFIVPWYLAVMFGPWLAIYIRWFRIGNIGLGTLFFGDPGTRPQPVWIILKPKPIPAADMARLPLTLDDVDRFPWAAFLGSRRRALEIRRRFHDLFAEDPIVRRNSFSELSELIGDQDGIHPVTPYALLPLIQHLRSGQVKDSNIEEGVLDLLSWCSKLGDQLRPTGWLERLISRRRPDFVPKLSVEDAVGTGKDVYRRYSKHDDARIRTWAESLVEFCSLPVDGGEAK